MEVLSPYQPVKCMVLRQAKYGYRSQVGQPDNFLRVLLEGRLSGGNKCSH